MWSTVQDCTGVGWLLVVLIVINSSNEIWLAAFIEIKINKFEEVKTEFLITLIEYTIVKWMKGNYCETNMAKPTIIPQRY